MSHFLSYHFFYTNSVCILEGLTNKLLYSVFIPMTITDVSTFQNTTFIIVFVISQTRSLVIIPEIKYYVGYIC